MSSGLWFGWFGWDSEYQFDSATGEMAGPYEVWQGVGALVCGVVVVGLAYRMLHFAVALLVIPASFTLAWISTASAMDLTGLWVVGAILVAFGTTFGTVVMLGAATAVEALCINRRTSRSCGGG
ncbi:hypothetical protein ACX80Z_14720 [Arthrobacter sp. TMT4-20]